MFVRLVSTDLQVYLESLVVDFCLKSDQMKFLCDDERGLQVKQVEER